MAEIMLTYAVKNGGDEDALYIAELRVQCTLAKQAYEKLIEHCITVDRSSPSRRAYGESPAVLIGHCVGFLSAVAVISKIIFPADKKARDRGQRLRSRFGITELPEVGSRAVRNAFEHVDEEIDRLPVPVSEDRVVLISTNEKTPDDPVVLKRFDPASCTIQFLGRTIDVEACYAEVLRVESAL